MVNRTLPIAPLRSVITVPGKFAQEVENDSTCFLYFTCIDFSRADWTGFVSPREPLEESILAKRVLAGSHHRLIEDRLGNGTYEILGDVRGVDKHIQVKAGHRAWQVGLGGLVEIKKASATLNFIPVGREGL